MSSWRVDFYSCFLLFQTSQFQWLDVFVIFALTVNFKGVQAKRRRTSMSIMVSPSIAGFLFSKCSSKYLLDLVVIEGGDSSG